MPNTGPGMRLLKQPDSVQAFECRTSAGASASRKLFRKFSSCCQQADRPPLVNGEIEPDRLATCPASADSALPSQSEELTGKTTNKTNQKKQ